MIPIYEQGGGRGIGYQLGPFLRRFDAICREHQKMGRANAFAFIFYDFGNVGIKKILKDEGVFANLDRLSGQNLSIFYLHTGTRHAVDQFNATFLKRLQVADTAEPPCVVFFRLAEDGLTDVSVAHLDHSDLIHAFKELYDVVERYMQGSTVKPKYMRWLKSGAKVIAIEAVVEAIKYGIGLH
jgi:hypothetical protein